MEAVGFVVGALCLIAGIAVWVLFSRKAAAESRSIEGMMHDMVSSEDEWEEESSHNRSLPTAQIEPREMTRQQSNVSHASAVSHPFVPHPHPHHQHVEMFPVPESPLSATRTRKKKAKSIPTPSRRPLKDRRSPPALEAFDSFRGQRPSGTPVSPRGRRRHGTRSVTPQTGPQPQQELQELVKLSSELREKRQMFSYKLHDHISNMSEALQTGPQGGNAMANSYSATSLHGMDEHEPIYSPRSYESHPFEDSVGGPGRRHLHRIHPHTALDTTTTGSPPTAWDPSATHTSTYSLSGYGGSVSPTQAYPLLTPGHGDLSMRSV